MFDRMRSSKRGISTVLGSVIFILIMLIMVTLFGWMLTQVSSYNEAAQRREQLDWERQNEHLRAIGLIMDEDSNSFFIMIENTGAVTATIDTIWLIMPWPHMFYPVEITLNPGNMTTYVFTQTDVTLDPYEEYTLRLVTKRGNIVNIRYPFVLGDGGITPAGYIDIGPVRLDYGSFTWTSKDYPDKQPGWTIPANEKAVYWYVSITNICDMNITLTRFSMILMTSPTGGSIPFFIISPDSTTVNLIRYSPGEVTLYCNTLGDWTAGGMPVELVFGAKDDGGGGPKGGYTPQNMGSEGEYTVFVVLFGSYSDGSPYAQTIPFEAVLCSG